MLRFVCNPTFGAIFTKLHEFSFLNFLFIKLSETSFLHSRHLTCWRFSTQKSSAFVNFQDYILILISVFVSGPSTWVKNLSIEIGHKQSPINIINSQAAFDPSLNNLKFSYPNFETATLLNNGHTVMFRPNNDNSSRKWEMCGRVFNN